MKMVLGIMVTLVLGVLFLNVLATPFTNSSTEASSQTFSVITGAADTTQPVTLASQHWFADTTQLTVACATDTAAVAQSLDTTRLIIVVGVLTVSTTQDCIVTHLREKQKSNGDVKEFVGVLKILPLLTAISVLAASFAGVALGGSNILGKSVGGFGGRQSATVDMGSFIVLLVGMFLIESIEGFVDTAQVTYDNLPEFSGTSSLLSIVLIGYVLSMITLGLGGAAGLGRRATGRQ